MNLLNGKSKHIDKFSIIHFLIWIYVGFFIQNQYILVIIINILWEISEYAIVHINPIYNLIKKYWIVPEQYWNETLTNKCFDLLFDILGYSLGCYIYTKYYLI